ncbi:hypothetical protein G7B40_020895 [Aetokthonos hydrillicola Thurmond2011]|jgi:hypothetical protein|uniref:Uncharacterized protein n=1 Tax=Aetokthonos hydrillicola Thurmond2011 TaxID=2712845 RepID=A0AAP5M990_9CYAN|nr:hypothetical protein [Aetokthonos hydrillicola]MBO3458690.1 hypothetical protein [Aetokthonos hydrillicola CCALA 1050]MBW4588043.1 hypothetical protein [Aetokthonos hydrillicola CCALA 1050]MDR9897005.1 hypothetical protein [Aetokthonos hydrillicola Thurmond2011]
MVDSLKESLKVVTPYLNHNLVSPKAISRINEIANFLPAMPVVSDVLLECHLNGNDPRVDISTGFHDGDVIVKHRSVIENLCQDTFTTDVWLRIINFCTHWIESKSFLQSSLNSCWLEFDADSTLNTIPVPSFFIGTKIIKEKNDNLYNHEKTIEDILDLLLNNNLSKRLKYNVFSCFNLLPKGGKIANIGIMFPRESERNTVRLCMGGLTGDQIVKYLHDINWIGSISEIQAMIADLSNIVDVIHLNFAIGDGVLPKIGLECQVKTQNLIQTKWNTILDYLVSQQLCNPEQQSSLLDWIGYSYENSNQDFWPNDLVKVSGFLAPSFRSVFWREINHVKLVYQPHQPVEAKVYLRFDHCWLSPTTLIAMMEHN